MQVKCYLRVKLVTLSLYMYQKLKCFLMSFKMSISKTCIPNDVCGLTKRYKTYQIAFSFFRLGHVPGVGLVGADGVKKFTEGICDGAQSTARSILFLSQKDDKVVRIQLQSVQLKSTLF